MYHTKTKHNVIQGIYKSEAEIGKLSCRILYSEE